MNYAKELQRAVSGAKPAEGFSPEELRRRIATISEEMKGPMSAAERIALCEVRASYRAALRRVV